MTYMKYNSYDPELIVLVGPPASGKSTWRASFLEDKDVEDYIILSTDDYLDKMALEKGITYSQAFDKYVKDAEAILTAKLKAAIKYNKNVIWDQTNLAYKKRQRILNAFPAHYLKKVIAFEVDEDVLFDRLMRRGEETGKVISRGIVINMMKSYVKPSLEEGFMEINTIIN